MRRWIVLATLSLGCALLPIRGHEAPASARLLNAAQACQVRTHAFYIEAAATLPEGQARAVLRLAAQAAREWPMGEAEAVAVENGRRITLAATCPPDPARAQSIERRMRMLLGRDAQVSTCLTGRADGENLAALAERALVELGDMPRQALRETGLVSLTGERAQVALRGDGQGAMVFLACPFVPMDY